MARRQRKPIPGSLGERLRKARERDGFDWSQKALADRAGIRQSSLSELEIGETVEISGPTLIAIAAALKVRPEWLLNDELPMEAGAKVAKLEPDLQAVANLWEYVTPPARKRILAMCQDEAKRSAEKAQELLRSQGATGVVTDEAVRDGFARRKATLKA